MVGSAKFGDEDEMETPRLCIPTRLEFCSYFFMQIHVMSRQVPKVDLRTFLSALGVLQATVLYPISINKTADRVA